MYIDPLRRTPAVTTFFTRVALFSAYPWHARRQEVHHEHGVGDVQGGSGSTTTTPGSSWTGTSTSRARTGTGAGSRTSGSGGTK
jgi:hypothetical protein